MLEEIKNEITFEVFLLVILRLQIEQDGKIERF